MAKFVNGKGLTTITVNGVDLTSHVNNVDAPKNADQHDVTGFDAVAHEFLLGLSNDGCTLNFWQDFDSGSVDDTLSELAGENDPFPVVCDVTGGPTFTMQCILPNYTALTGAAGEPSATQCEFLCGDGQGWVRS